MMPFEIGGRADKGGNRYEVKVAIYYILQLLDEQIEHVVIEAIGQDEEGTDIWIKKLDGTRVSLQCKARNASLEYWRYTDLKEKGIFTVWKNQLERNRTTEVSLVSPLTFTLLEDIISRSKNTNNNPLDFYNYQIKNSSGKLNTLFNNICSDWNLNPKIDADILKVKNFFTRINLKQLPDSYLEELITQKIKFLFSNNHNEVYNSIFNLIVEGDILGRELNLTFIYDYVNNQGFQFRKMSMDKKVKPRIIELNKKYSESFIPIQNVLIDRDEFEVCKENIKLGKSIIIHGKAGYGKSGYFH